MSRLFTTCPACGCDAERHRVLREFDYRRPDVEAVRIWVRDRLDNSQALHRIPSYLWKKFSKTPWVTTGWEEVECSKCKSTYRNVWTFESQEITHNQVEEAENEAEYQRAMEVVPAMYDLLQELHRYLEDGGLTPAQPGDDGVACLRRASKELIQTIKNGGE